MRTRLTSEEKELVDLIKRNPIFLCEYKRYISLLGDYLPQNKPLKIALTYAYQEGIFDILRENGDINQILYRCRKALEKNCAILPQYALRAVEIAAVICEKDILFEEEEPYHKGETFEISDEKMIANFSTGHIEYTRYKNGIVITNLEYVLDGLNVSKTAIIVPETIMGYPVLGVLPNAFNVFRYNKIRMVIVPNTVEFIGDENQKFYQNFSAKGTFTKPKIFYAKKKYEQYAENVVIADKLLEFKEDEYFGFEVSLELLEQNDFLLINKYQNSNDYWTYPENDMWIAKGVLEYYSGTSERLIVDGCARIGKGAFNGVNITEIIFSDEIVFFESYMITNCHKLKKIVFESEKRCWFGEGAISGCELLKEVKWPRILNFEQISIYNTCPQLGDMIVHRRLLTCQQEGEVIFLDEGLERVNNGAFISCKNAKVLFVPKSITVVEADALIGSNIEIVIFEGQYTQWKAHAHNSKYIYVYSREGSSVAHSISPYNPEPMICMKNLNRLVMLDFQNIDIDKLCAICYENMNKKSDDEMIAKPYGWDRELYQKG